MSARGQEFSQLVYQILVVEQKPTLREVARRMGIEYDALHARLNGRTLFSAEEIALLIGVVQDPRLVAYMLRHSKFVGVERPDGRPDDPEEEIVRATHRILLETADVLKAVDGAFDDSRIDHREARAIDQEIEVAERALIALRERVRRFF